MTNDYSTERAAALAMLNAGLATASEVARLAGVSRQLVRHWATQEGIDPRRIRDARLAKEWRKLVKRR